MDGEKAFHFSYLKAHMLIRKEKQQLASLFSEVIGQEDIFSLVRLPLIENCLLGFNSSIFAYGQIGSGKTYTMWGPLSALSEDSTSSERGLTPRVFEQLFSRIEEEKVKHADKELTYNCVCSFLEK